MLDVRSALLETGVGLSGDKHAGSASRRQVLIIDKETLDVLGLAPGTVKENLTVELVNTKERLELAEEDVQDMRAGVEVLSGQLRELHVTPRYTPPAARKPRDKRRPEGPLQRSARRPLQAASRSVKRDFMHWLPARHAGMPIFR